MRGGDDLLVRAGGGLGSKGGSVRWRGPGCEGDGDWVVGDFRSIVMISLCGVFCGLNLSAYTFSSFSLSLSFTHYLVLCK